MASSTIETLLPIAPVLQPAWREKGAEPQPSKGQQGYELGIQGWLGLLGLPLVSRSSRSPAMRTSPHHHEAFAAAIPTRMSRSARRGEPPGDE
jgi:hypothetical protein